MTTIKRDQSKFDRVDFQVMSTGRVITANRVLTNKKRIRVGCQIAPMAIYAGQLFPLAHLQIRSKTRILDNNKTNEAKKKINDGTMYSGTPRIPIPFVLTDNYTITGLG